MPNNPDTLIFKLTHYRLAITTGAAELAIRLLFNRTR